VNPPTFRPEAAADIEEACRWHEARRPGLGDEFLDGVGEALGFLGVRPESAPVVHRDVRRQLLRRFPYGIFYGVIDGQVVVLGCFHARRDPRTWRSPR